MAFVVARVVALAVAMLLAASSVSLDAFLAAIDARERMRR
jgi:hypothetical protein